MAYSIVAIGLIIVVIALTCMLLNKNESIYCANKARASETNVKWPWIPDDFNGPLYLAPPGFLSGSTEQQPQLVDGRPMRLLKNQYQCPDAYMGCWSGCDFPMKGTHSRACPYYHGKKATVPAAGKIHSPAEWGAYYLKGTPYSPQGYPGYTKESTRVANSRLGIPRTFSPIDSCKVGYDYGLYSSNACLPFLSTKKGPQSIIDY